MVVTARAERGAQHWRGRIIVPWIPGMDIAIAVRVLAVPFISTTVLTAAASLSGVLIINRVRVSDLVKKRFA
jgi:hypothetical protein